MKVYADLRWSWQGGAAGIDNVKRELLDRVPPHVHVVELKIAGGVGSPLSPLAIARALDSQVPASGVFWSPGFMPPAWSRIPAVATVHDLIHLKHYSPFHRAYYEYVLRPMYRRCRLVLCVSEYTRAELLAWSGIDPERAITIYNGVSDRFFAHHDGPAPFEFPYVLYAGNRRGYKNLERLLRAYASSSLPSRQVHLVMTGSAERSLQRQARALGIGQVVHFAGHVSDAQMPALYRGAQLVALVSLDEGFGLPIIEAMASGVPVLTSARAAMAEVAADAGRLIDPFSVASIREGLEILAFDPAERATRIRLGHQRARGFRWDGAAARFWSVLTEVGGESPRALP